MKIYARKTNIQTISTHEADEFIKQHHDQGLPTIGKGRFDSALTYNGEVVGVITCCNPRTTAKKKQYQQELVRLTFKTGVRVVGGASKLIKHYIDTVKPRNFFTYQTLGGELTSVYEHAGMTFVKKTKTKTVLVKNGYMYKEALASRTQKYLYLNAQLANLGPDRLLGTQLGEVYEDGKRLTNPELFIRYCDYHKETVPGDAVYVYENSTQTEPEKPNVVTPKPTKPKVSRKVTLEWCDECGGETKWRYGRCTKTKAPVKRFKPKKETTRQYCETCQKETRHVGEQCMSCVEKSLYNQQTCPTHGLTKFRANKCCACRAERMRAKRKENKI